MAKAPVKKKAAAMNAAPSIRLNVVLLGNALLRKKMARRYNKKPKSYAKDTTVASPYMAGNDGTMVPFCTGVDYNM